MQRKTRLRRGQQRVGKSKLRSQSIGKACVLDRDVLPHELQLFAERDLVGLMTRERAAQEFAEVLDNPHGALPIVVTNEHGDRIQRVEKEMRIELRLQRREPRTRELLGQPCDL